MIVRSTVSHVPQAAPAPQALDPHPADPQELAPQVPQLDAHGAEQHRLVRRPKQPPASAVEVSATTSAIERNNRILSNSSENRPRITLNTTGGSRLGASKRQSGPRKALMPKQPAQGVHRQQCLPKHPILRTLYRVSIPDSTEKIQIIK
jgi:hypothetical protein